MFVTFAPCLDCGVLCANHAAMQGQSVSTGVAEDGDACPVRWPHRGVHFHITALHAVILSCKLAVSCIGFALDMWAWDDCRFKDGAVRR
jgi:hypothetical protein